MLAGPCRDDRDIYSRCVGKFTAEAERTMNSALISASRSLLAAIAALAGVLFFFVIIGVFGLPASIAALVIFVALSLTIFRRPQDEEMQR